MKRIKYVLIIALVFMLGITNVFAEGPKPESSEVTVGGKVLYQKGQKITEELVGATFDDSTMTLTLTSELNITNGEGIKVIDMGDEFNILVKGNVNINLLERNDGIFIVNTKVNIDSIEEGTLKIIPVEGSGIIVEGTSELHLKRIGLDAVSVRFKDQTVVASVYGNYNNTTYYRNGEEILTSDITISDPVPQTTEQPKDTESEPQYKRRDTFNSVSVYAIVAGILVVGGIIVLLVSVKNQKK